MKRVSTLIALCTIVALFLCKGQDPLKPKVSQNFFFFISSPIREMTVVIPGDHQEKHLESLNRTHKSCDTIWDFKSNMIEDAIQKKQGHRQCRGPILSFEGINNRNNNSPADPNGDVGPNHYVQMVNSSFAVWDKSGNIIYGPADYQTIWDSYPGPWQNFSWYDPVVKYDQIADRWIMISMAISSSDYYTMVAVSSSSDPLGSYHCYAYHFSNINDYPKISIWPDAYYMSHNFYDVPKDWLYLYTSYIALDRAAMLNGDSVAEMIEFQVHHPGDGQFFPLPVDCRGNDMPPDTGAYFMIAGNTDTFNPMKWNLDVYQFTADWKNTANATFELDTRFELGQYELPGVWGGPGAPQMGNEVNISTVPFYLMYPATYRRFENFESMVCCQTIFSDGLHFLKWFELRNENSEWFINQSGNYAPEDEHFYIPSITLNGNGDIAMGYFVSSQDTYPSVHFTGRRKNDPPGMMTFQELELIKGLYFANTYNSLHQKNRWGDYASMMVDPVDDTTFWFTSMYPIYPTTYGNWSTRIFSLSLTEDIATVVADAGNDTLTCNVGFFQLNSHAENYSSITWNSEGDGSFSNFHSLRATYLRGPEDLANQQVTLTMSATGYQPGSETEDSMVLYLNKIPEVDAGEDMSINYNESVSLNGNVLYAYEYFWATIGDGAFNDTSKLDAIYTPGPADIESREVTLVLTGWEVAPCSGAYRDSLTLFVLPFNISEQSGKHMSMKIYPLPATDIVTVEVNINSGEGAVLQILSQDGNAVFKGDYSPTNRKLVQQFDITYLPIGIYFIRVQAGKEVATRKLLVVR